MIEKECPACGVVYKTFPSVDKKFCSNKCCLAFKKNASFHKYKRVCENCGKIFLPPRPAEGGQYCSYACRGIASRKERVDRNGYWFVCRPDHPKASKQGYVAEHTVIMESHIGRYLLEEEVVHHKDGDRKNNSIGNLELMTSGEHRALHIKQSLADGKMCTPDQRKRASERMTRVNKHRIVHRDSSGRFTKKRG